jgi:hypothetical protein
MGVSVFWKPQGLSRPVMGLLYLRLIKQYAMNMYGGDKIRLLAFLTSRMG